MGERVILANNKVLPNTFLQTWGKPQHIMKTAMILLYRHFLSYDDVQFRNRTQTLQGNKIPEISGLKTMLRGKTGTEIPDCKVLRIIQKGTNLRRYTYYYERRFVMPRNLSCAKWIQQKSRQLHFCRLAFPSCDGLQLHYNLASIRRCDKAHTFKPVRCKPRRCLSQTQAKFSPEKGLPNSRTKWTQLPKIYRTDRS
jgi:hypothetical protein